MLFNDLTGNQYGYLTVISIDTNPSNKRTRWICRCKCGNTKSVLAYSLTSGHVISCGCRRYEAKNQTHGMRHTRIYNIWCDMKKRCYNPNSKSFPTYGAKGIKLCDEWKNSFEVFYSWAISAGYADNLTIDRIDVNSDYFPENCRWISFEEQQRNKTSNIVFSHNGESHCLREWCRLIGFDEKLAYSRCSTLRSKNLPITYDGIFLFESSANNKPREVLQFTIDGTFVKKYASIASVEKDGYSRIPVSRCCNGKQNATLGFIWKFVQEDSGTAKP